MNGRWLWCAFALTLAACSTLPDKPVESFNLANQQYLYGRQHWFFEGRLSMVNETDSVTAAVNWQHQKDREDIELVGPLAQGRLLISLQADKVVVDDGDQAREYSGKVEDVVAEQLRVDVPVESLRYWVLGLSDPQQKFVEQKDGFFQAGWLIRFREMQKLDNDWLPRKMTAEKDKTRIKLIVDRWDFS